MLHWKLLLMKISLTRNVPAFLSRRKAVMRLLHPFPSLILVTPSVLLL